MLWGCFIFNNGQINWSELMGTGRKGRQCMPHISVRGVDMLLKDTSCLYLKLHWSLLRRQTDCCSDGAAALGGTLWLLFPGEGAPDVIRASQSLQPGEGQRHVAVKRLRLLWIRGHQRHRSGRNTLGCILMRRRSAAGFLALRLFCRLLLGSTGCSWATKSSSSRGQAWELKTPILWVEIRSILCGLEN